MRLRHFAPSGLSQGLLDDDAAEAVGDKENGPVPLIWIASKSLEGAEQIACMVKDRLLTHWSLKPVSDLGVVSVSEDPGV